MIKRWRTVLCGVCAAIALTACGAAKEEIRQVEQEDISVNPSEEKAEEPKAEETKGEETKEEEMGAEEEEKAPEGTETAAETENSSVEAAAGKPAVVTIEQEKQEYRDGDVLLMTAGWDHVTVSVEGNEAAARAVMEVFEKREREFQETVAEMVEDAKEDTLVTESGMSYDEEQGYEVQRNDGKVLSFAFGTGGFSGGAHGYYMEYGLNFDAETGKVLSIEDIAQDITAFQEICVQEMLRQCEDLKEQGVLYDDGMLTVIDLQEILEGKMEGEEWYFTQDGIRFISNIYEIAPYAAGNFMFDIPCEMVNETLKEAYRVNQEL